MDTTIILPAGGKLHASRSHLCLAFEKTRFSLSTAIYGGGFKEINYAVNQKLETFYPSEDRFPGGSVPEFLRLSILENGYDPAKACALLTAAKMEWRSVKTFSHKELLLDAVTTGGAEKTAARAGSPPLYTEKDGHFFPVGTINIMISLNISLPSAIMTRAIITITEGKTAALQDLGIADVNNGLPATGTGTDGITLITNPDAPRYTDAGTFSVLGSLLASAAYETVRECLELYDKPWNRDDSLATPPAVDLSRLRNKNAVIRQIFPLLL